MFVVVVDVVAGAKVGVVNLIGEGLETGEILLTMGCWGRTIKEMGWSSIDPLRSPSKQT